VRSLRYRRSLLWTTWTKPPINECGHDSTGGQRKVGQNSTGVDNPQLPRRDRPQVGGFGHFDLPAVMPLPLSGPSHIGGEAGLWWSRRLARTAKPTIASRDRGRIFRASQHPIDDRASQPARLLRRSARASAISFVDHSFQPSVADACALRRRLRRVAMRVVRASIDHSRREHRNMPVGQKVEPPRRRRGEFVQRSQNRGAPKKG